MSPFPLVTARSNLSAPNLTLSKGLAPDAFWSALTSWAPVTSHAYVSVTAFPTKEKLITGENPTMLNTSRKTRVAALCVAVALVATLFYCFFVAGRDKEISRVVFPDKSQEVAYLPVASKEQRLKTIRFAPDGFTRLSGTIFWNSGLIEDMTFVNNEVASSVEFYPVDDKEGLFTRGIKRSEAKFAADGTTYTYHAVFRKDGTMERKGQLERTGTYISTYYFEDGQSVSRQRFFDARKRYKQEKIYRRDGSVLASVFSEAGDYLKTDTSLYREDGTLYATISRSDYNGETGRVFAANGSTMIVEYARDYYNVAEAYLAENGDLLQKRQGSRMSGLLVVNGYKKVGAEMRMETIQRWSLTQTLGPDADKVKLRRVEFYDFASARTCEIQMDVDGAKALTVACKNKDGSKTFLKNYNIPAAWLQNVRPTPLPEWKDENAPPPVYDYH